MLILMFLFLGAFFIISNEGLKISNGEDFYKLGESYYSWVGGLFLNAKSLTGYVVKFDWLPGQEFNSSN